MKVPVHRRSQIAGLALALLFGLSPEMRGALAEGQVSAVQTAAETQATPSPVTAAEPASSSNTAAAPAAAPQLPDSPGAVRSQISTTEQVQTTETAQTAPQTGATGPAQAPETGQGETPPSNNQKPEIQKPAGTAAAEAPVTNGIAASAPAGAAIAPAPQRRVHSWLIKMGAVVGAGVALGTVMALSSASPSRPPGSH